MITPIHLVETDAAGNQFYLKREDLLPFSFGGNKARIGAEYLRDMREKGCDHLLAYGNARSNLCRVLSNLCAMEGLPITILSPADDDGSRHASFNEKLCRQFGAQIVPCQKTGVAETVDKALEQIRALGHTPYYIYGDRYGKGNEATPTAAYVPVYEEIQKQGDFDVIALALGTGMTMAGLLCGQKRHGGKADILGLSVARDAENARAHVLAYMSAWLKDDGLDASAVHICDAWRESYGVYDETVAQTIRDMMTLHGVPMDGTYTGKAYAAMKRLCAQERWQNKKVLFLHTGGTPLFFDSCG